MMRHDPTHLRDALDPKTALESGVEVRAAKRELLQPGRVRRHGQRGRARRSGPYEPRVRLALASSPPPARRLVRPLLLTLAWVPPFGQGSTQW